MAAVTLSHFADSTENCAEVVECVGQVGIPAENVAKQAVLGMRRYQTAGVPVGEHLADQLLLPMVLGAGGMFHTLQSSRHTKTNRDVIKLFSDRAISFEELNRDRWAIRVE